MSKITVDDIVGKAWEKANTYCSAKKPTITHKDFTLIGCEEFGTIAKYNYSHDQSFDISEVTVDLKSQYAAYVLCHELGHYINAHKLKSENMSGHAEFNTEEMADFFGEQLFLEFGWNDYKQRRAEASMFFGMIYAATKFIENRQKQRRKIVWSKLKRISWKVFLICYFIGYSLFLLYQWLN